MPQSTLQDTVEVGGTPGSIDAGTDPTPGKSVQVRAYPWQEYVSGSSLQWLTNYVRSLPQPIDDVGQDFGLDLYWRMMYDPQVRSVVQVVMSSVLEESVRVDSAVAKKEDDGYQQAKTLTETIERMFSDLSTPLDDVLWDMLYMIAVGNRVGELVFQLDGQYTLDAIRVKPAESYAFAVDAYMNLVGILARIPGIAYPVQSGMMMLDVEHAPNLLPKSKFAILSFRPKDGDPRGTSILRPAYNAWWQKMQIHGEYLKYLTQFATPSVIGKTPPNALPYPQLNPDGTPVLDQNGNQVYLTPEQALGTSLAALANGTYTAVPAGTEIDVIPMVGEGKPFQAAYSFFDQQIAKAVLGSTLATEEGEHQARAAADTHKNVMDTGIRPIRRPVERMLRDILKTWMLLNGQEKLIPLLPVCSLGAVEQEDQASLITSMAQLNRAGYLHPSMYPFTDQLLGLEGRTPPDAAGLPMQEIVSSKDGIVPVPDTSEDEEEPTPQPAPSGVKPQDATSAAA